MRAVIEKLNELAPDAYDTGADMPAQRAAYNKERRYWNEGGPEMAETRDDVIDTPNGSVPVRLHVPENASDSALVYLHGGGFILGNLDTHDRIMRVLASESGATVIGVDYALSPEAKFPVALLQSAAVVRHLQSNYGFTRIGLAGDSGGAQLSLATYLYLREAGEPNIAALLLYYGLYGLRDSASRRLLGGPWDGLTQADLQYYEDCYLADPADAASPYVDCLSADLSDLPPTFICAAELDPLRDDSAALAVMLQTHEVPIKYIVYPGVLHAFLHNSRHLETAGQALRDGALFYSHH